MPCTWGPNRRINRRADPQDSAGAAPLDSYGQVREVVVVAFVVADVYPMTRKTRQILGLTFQRQKLALRSSKLGFNIEV